MSSRAIKKTVLELLAGDDVHSVLHRLEQLPAEDVVHALFVAICRPEETIRWNGVKAMGVCVARIAAENMESGRIVMRRLLWSLNDESGGIGWGAPEAMAEIMCCHQGLAEEYIHMLISYMREDGEELFQDGNFLEHEVLQRGLLWGIGRLAAARPEMLRRHNAAADLQPYLQAADPAVRGLAARALGLLGATAAVRALKELVGDQAIVRFYGQDGLRSTTVDELARRALEQIAASTEN